MSRVSAVVVNHNGSEQILRCLRALRTQGPALSELMTVDNGSTDRSVAAIEAEFPDVTVIELGCNLGPAAARNAGLRQAGSALVLLVDDDVYLGPDCLRLLLIARSRSRPRRSRRVSFCCPAAIAYHERGAGTPGLSFRITGPIPSAGPTSRCATAGAPSCSTIA